MRWKERSANEIENEASEMFCGETKRNEEERGSFDSLNDSRSSNTSERHEFHEQFPLGGAHDGGWDPRNHSSERDGEEDGRGGRGGVGCFEQQERRVSEKVSG